MKIQDINIFNKNVIKTGELLEVGSFQIEDGKLKFNKSQKLSNEEYQCDFGRVYIISVNDIIYKIGGSSAKGGIKKTINSYVTGNSGSPGESRFAINSLITSEIQKGRDVKVYMILSTESFVRINGLTTTNKMVPVFAFKEIEKLCLDDHKQFDANQPIPMWNFKERGVPYPEEIRKAYANYKTNNAN